MSEQLLIFGQAFEVQANTEGETTKRVLVIPADADGLVRSTHGDSYLTPEGAEAIIAEFDERESDMVVDYEHQSMGKEYNTRPDGQAPAAGWISKLIYEPGRGIWGMVRWTAKAAQDIKDKAYRYLSPVFAVDKATRKIRHLLNAGLVNAPAILDMPAVAAKRSLTEEFDMGSETKTKPKVDEVLAINQDGEGGEGGGAIDPTVVAEALGELKATLKAKGVEAGTGQLAIIRAAIDALGGESEGGGAEGGEEAVAESKAVRVALKLETDATTETVIGALKLKGGSTPDTEVKAMQTRLDTLEKVEGDRKVDDIIAAHVKAGRINPNEDESRLTIYRNMAASDPEDLDKLLPAAGKAIPPQGETHGPKTGNRANLIAHSAAEWKGDTNIQRMNDRSETWINQSLRDANLGELTEKETEALAV